MGTSTKLPLFPGYIFSRFNPLHRLPVLITTGVVKIVGCGTEPVPVCDREISALQTIDGSYIPREPVMYLDSGDLVQIVDGPLTGLSGIVLESNKRKRLVVSLTLLRRAVAVELDRSWLTLRAEPARPPMTIAAGAQHV